MSQSSRPAVGTIAWTDLTVPDAGRLRDFYAAVVGWAPSDVEMDGYQDYSMRAPGTGVPAAGICHARGQNAELPAQWLIYLVVADLDASLGVCLVRGGTLLHGPGSMGDGSRFCVIRDPAGAVAALFQPGA